MKKTFTVMAIVICAVALMTFYALATDTSKRPGYYDDKGMTVGEMILEIIDSTNYDESLSQSGLAGLFGTATNSVTKQLERRFMTVPITMTSAGADTFFSPLMVVPTGATVYIDKIQLSCAVEATGAGVARGQIVYYKWQGDTMLVIDTLCAKVELDADSAIVYADSIYTMAHTDSTLTAGELVFWREFNSGASTIEGPCVTLYYRLDE